MDADSDRYVQSVCDAQLPINERLFHLKQLVTRSGYQALTPHAEALAACLDDSHTGDFHTALRSVLMEIGWEAAEACIALLPDKSKRAAVLDALSGFVGAQARKKKLRSEDEANTLIEAASPYLDDPDDKVKYGACKVLIEGKAAGGSLDSLGSEDCGTVASALGNRYVGRTAAKLLEQWDPTQCIKACIGVLINISQLMDTDKDGVVTETEFRASAIEQREARLAALRMLQYLFHKHEDLMPDALSQDDLNAIISCMAPAEDRSVRNSCLGMLIALGQTDAVGNFLSELSSERQDDLLLALRTLYDAGTYAIPYAPWVVRLISMPTKDSDKFSLDQSKLALKVLSKFGEVGAKAFADEYMTVNQKETREWAFRSLTKMGDLSMLKMALAPHIHHVVGFLNDGFCRSDKDKVHVITLLGKMQEVAAPHHAVISEYLSHSNEDLVVTALSALAAFGNAAGSYAAQVVALLDHRCMSVPIAALRVLATVGPAAVPHTAAIASCLEPSWVDSKKFPSNRRQMEAAAQQAALIALLSVGKPAGAHAGKLGCFTWSEMLYAGQLTNCLSYHYRFGSTQLRLLALGGLARLGQAAVIPHVSAVAECLEWSHAKKEPQVSYCALQVLSQVGPAASKHSAAIARCLSSCTGTSRGPYQADTCKLAMELLSNLGKFE